MRTERSDRSADAAAGQVSKRSRRGVRRVLCAGVVRPVGRADARRGTSPSKGTACSMSVPVRAWLPVRPCGGWARAVPSSPSIRTTACSPSPSGWRPGWTCAGVRRSSCRSTTDEIDCVTCQFALMYFQDRARAIREIARVTRPGGRVAVATWAAVEESPGYAAMVDLLGDEIGDWAAEATRAPFCIGTADRARRPAADVVPRCRRRTSRGSSMLPLARRMDAHRDPRVDAGRARRRRPIRTPAGTGRHPARRDLLRPTAGCVSPYPR